jgi:hypothetical protein
MKIIATLIMNIISFYTFFGIVEKVKEHEDYLLKFKNRSL